MNSSIYAIFLTSVLSFFSSFFSFMLFKRREACLVSLFAITILALSIYLNLKGRAALFGSFTGAFYLLYLSGIMRKKALIFSALFGLVLLLVMILNFVKRDSTSGRILIYKVIFTQLKPNDFFFGLGVGKFKANYNKLQALYFKRAKRNENEILLAGNGYYLYNDWAQLILEVGVIRLLLFALFGLLLFKFFYWNPADKPVLIAANVVLVAIGTASFFSYPLQIPGTLFIVILCLCIHLCFAWKVKEKYRRTNFLLVVRCVFPLTLLCGISYAILFYWYSQKTKMAFEFNRDGQTAEAETLFRKLEKVPIKDYNTHYNYAFLLYLKNEQGRALEQIDKSLSLVYSQTSVKLKADILYELKRIEDAEFFYMTAVYITPGRMMPKLNLLQFYIKTRQKEKIQLWAKEIITMPVKIPSQKATDIREQAKEILRQYPL